MGGDFGGMGGVSPDLQQPLQAPAGTDLTGMGGDMSLSQVAEGQVDPTVAPTTDLGGFDPTAATAGVEQSTGGAAPRIQQSNPNSFGNIMANWGLSKLGMKKDEKGNIVRDEDQQKKQAPQTQLPQYRPPTITQRNQVPLRLLAYSRTKDTPLGQYTQQGQ